MLRTVCLALGASALGVLSAFAQSAAPQGDASDVRTIFSSEPATDESLGLTLTPRFWYTVTEGGAFSTGTTAITSVESLSIPLFGGSISYSPPDWKGSALSLTGFFGTGETRTSLLTELGGPAVFSDSDVSRLDVELLYQRPFTPRRNVYAVGGFRYIDVESDVAGPTPLVAGSIVSETRSRLFQLQGGVGFNTPVDEAGASALFANIQGLVGVGTLSSDVTTTLVGVGAASDSLDETLFSYGADVNAGYSYSGRRISASFRYRLTYGDGEDLSDGAGGEIDSFAITHGPEVNLGVRF